MDPKVRELYKRFVFVARDYPAGRQAMMPRVKQAFLANAQLQQEIEIKKAIAKGRYYAREVAAINQLHKYRHLKKTYYDNVTEVK
jgi:hypothetical protein